MQSGEPGRSCPRNTSALDKGGYKTIRSARHFLLAYRILAYLKKTLQYFITGRHEFVVCEVAFPIITNAMPRCVRILLRGSQI